MNLCIQKGLMQLVSYRDERNKMKKKKKENCELKLTSQKLRGLLRGVDLKQVSKVLVCDRGRGNLLQLNLLTQQCGFHSPPQRILLQKSLIYLVFGSRKQ